MDLVRKIFNENKKLLNIVKLKIKVFALVLVYYLLLRDVKI